MPEPRLNSPADRAILPWNLSILIPTLGLTVAATLSWYLIYQPSFDLQLLHLPAVLFWLGLLVLIAIPGTRVAALPILFLATPGLLDDFFPSVFIGPVSELQAAPVPILSFIDIGLVIASLCNLRERRLQGMNIDAPVVIIGMLFIVGVISTAFAAHTPGFTSLGPSMVVLANVVRWSVVYINVRAMLSHPTSWQQLLLGLASVIVVLCADALFITTSRGLDRLTAGSLGNNVFGNILAVLSVILIASWLAKPSRYRRLIGFGAILAVAMLILTFTRMSLLALMIGTTLIATRYYRDRLSRGRRLAILAVVVALVPLSFTLVRTVPQLERYDPTSLTALNIQNVNDTEWNEGVNSMMTRVLLWQASVRMINDSPVVGVGPGQWNAVKNDYGFPRTIMIDAHNGFLQIGGEFGILGLILYGALLGIILIRWLRLRRIDQFAPAALCGLGLAVWLFTELTNAGINKYRVSCFVFLLAAFIMNDSRGRRDPEGRRV